MSGEAAASRGPRRGRNGGACRHSPAFHACVGCKSCGRACVRVGGRRRGRKRERREGAVSAAELPEDAVGAVRDPPALDADAGIRIRGPAAAMVAVGRVMAHAVFALLPAAPSASASPIARHKRCVSPSIPSELPARSKAPVPLLFTPPTTRRRLSDTSETADRPSPAPQTASRQVSRGAREESSGAGLRRHPHALVCVRFTS